MLCMGHCIQHLDVCRVIQPLQHREQSKACTRARLLSSAKNKEQLWWSPLQCQWRKHSVLERGQQPSSVRAVSLVPYSLWGRIFLLSFLTWLVLISLSSQLHSEGWTSSQQSLPMSCCLLHTGLSNGAMEGLAKPGCQQEWKKIRKHSEKLKFNYFLSVWRLLYCRALVYDPATQANNRDQSSS